MKHGGVPSAVRRTLTRGVRDGLCHRSGAQVNQRLLRPPWYTRALPHTDETDADPQPGGKRGYLQRRQGPPNRHRDREKRGLPPRCYTASEHRNKAMLLDVTYGMQTHKRRATCVRAAPTETDRLLSNLRRAGAATTTPPCKKGHSNRRAFNPKLADFPDFFFFSHFSFSSPRFS